MVVAANKSDIGHGDAATKARNKTSQELRILSSVTINCQVTKIVINPGSQFSIL